MNFRFHTSAVVYNQSHSYRDVSVLEQSGAVCVNLEILLPQSGSELAIQVAHRSMHDDEINVHTAPLSSPALLLCFRPAVLI